MRDIRRDLEIDKSYKPVRSFTIHSYRTIHGKEHDIQRMAAKGWKVHEDQHKLFKAINYEPKSYAIIFVR